jgi:hypothetical protein
VLWHKVAVLSPRALAVFVLAIVAVAAGCPGTPKPADGGRVAPHASEITLFFTTELRGTVEPCGCTSDPLGDLARTAELVRGARKERPVALFDGGSSLYDELPVPPLKAAQDSLTADLIARTLPQLGLAAAGLGPYDLGVGPGGLRFPRQAANLDLAAPALEPPKIVDVGGVKLGVFGVVDPLAVPDLAAREPAVAARAAIDKLRAQGADLVVGLAHMKLPGARRLAREVPGIDLLLVGQEAPERAPDGAEAVGSTFLVVPANRGQVVARVDLHLDPAGGPLTDAIGPERARADAARLGPRIAKLEADLAVWSKDPNAEPAFVERNRAALEAMKKEEQALRERPLRAPDKGSWFVLRAVAIQRALACDPAVVTAKRELDAAVGDANRAAAKDEKPAPPAAGKPGFAGVEECGSCHKAAVAFWKTTRHAAAWQTLVEVGKQGNRDCVGCHLTGWLEPGGSTLGVNEALRDVQCEVCHGPASLHVDENGHDKPRSIARAPAEDLCATRCHTAEHSDTFQREAYLRDVTGPGHGEKLRARLGDGPTGHALRAAALAKAEKGLGANCPK